jgi:hypothetical protein
VKAHQHVVQDAQVLKQPDILEGPGHAQEGAGLGRQALQFLPGKGHGPLGGVHKTAQEIEHRGLARAVGADEAVEAPCRQGQVEIVQGQEPPEFHPQMLDVKESHAGAGPAPPPVIQSPGLSRPGQGQDFPGRGDQGRGCRKIFQGQGSHKLCRPLPLIFFGSAGAVLNKGMNAPPPEFTGRPQFRPQQRRISPGLVQVHALVGAKIPQAVGDEPSLIQLQGPGHVGAMTQNQVGAPVHRGPGEAHQIAPIFLEKIFGFIPDPLGAPAFPAPMHRNYENVVFPGQGLDFPRSSSG